MSWKGEEGRALATAPKYFIDAHVHLMNPYRTKGGIKWIRRVVKEYDQLDLEISPGELLEQMKQAGADYFFNYFYPLKPGESREINRWQRDLADRHSEVISFASLHPGDDQKEHIIEEALDLLNLKGFKFHPYIQNFNILDKRMLPVYEILQERGCPVTIHTGFAKFYGKSSLTGDFLTLLRNYPKMQIIAAHLLYSDLPYEQWPGIMDQYPNLYLDVTNTFFYCIPGSGDMEGMQRLIQKYSRRMLFGSDYPMGMAYPVELLYEQVEKVCPNQETLEDIAWRTAAGLAGLGLT